MPVEQAAGADRRGVTHLEAIGRLLAGIAPWIELPPDDTPEGTARARTRIWRGGRSPAPWIPASPDFMNFTRERQPLVDAAFLAQGLLRAPRALRDALDAGDAAQPRRRARVDARHRAGVQQLAAVLRDGRSGAGRARAHRGIACASTTRSASTTSGTRATALYGDGPTFHWDYYNSFVIHPMLLDVLDVCRDEMPAWKELRRASSASARARYAAIQERLIAPEGTFPPIGRSIAYRFGAFHLLAQIGAAARAAGRASRPRRSAAR